MFHFQNNGVTAASGLSGALLFIKTCLRLDLRFCMTCDYPALHFQLSHMVPSEGAIAH
jgi:hypothetical protein